MRAHDNGRVILHDLSANPVLAEVVRSGFTESWHRGAIAALNDDGTFAFTRGTVNHPVFPGSASKPMQAVAMVRAGLPLEGELLALAAASHSGEDFHVQGVRDILDMAGLTAGDLRCPATLPADEATVRRLIRDGDDPESRVRCRCSGEHAAMLATCIVNEWPTGTYREPGHPLQVFIRKTVEELAREPVLTAGADDCGTPLLGLTLAGVARAFRALVRAAPGSPGRQVADAVRAFPEWASGGTRDERRLMVAMPGLLVKAGAEGVNAFALPDGRAGALKVDDGHSRALLPVTAEILRALGAEPPAELVAAAVTDGGRQAGEIVAAPLSVLS
jgi:L-asparaginase II